MPKTARTSVGKIGGDNLSESLQQQCATATATATAHAHALVIELGMLTPDEPNKGIEPTIVARTGEVTNRLIKKTPG